MIKKFNEYIKEDTSHKRCDDDYCVLYDRSEEIMSYISSRLESSIDNILSEAHERYKTSSGDILPDQMEKLENLENSLSELMYKQVSQNIEVDLEFLRNDVVDVDILKDLTDERHNCGEGDVVIAVYFSHLGIIKMKLKDRNGELVAIPNYKIRMNDADLIITVDTYNDFLSDPSKIIT